MAPISEMNLVTFQISEAILTHKLKNFQYTTQNIKVALRSQGQIWSYPSIQQWIMQPLKSAHHAKAECLPRGKPLQMKQNNTNNTGIRLTGSSMSFVKYWAISKALVELKDILRDTAHR